MLLRLTLALLAMLATAVVALRPDAAEAQRAAFTPGQVWSIKAASPSLKVVIARVEPFGDKVAVHLSIVGALVPEGVQGAGNPIRINHMPFEEAALAASVDRLLATGQPVEASVDEGIAVWRKDQGGIWTLGVVEALGALFEAFRAPARPT
jgi:hypothetical protein